VRDPLEEVAAGGGAKASKASPTRAAKAPAKKARARLRRPPHRRPPAPAGRSWSSRSAGASTRAECRYVRGVEGAELLTKAQATKQGFDACGVCKP
jgi:hypothetical protein